MSARGIDSVTLDGVASYLAKLDDVLRQSSPEQQKSVFALLREKKDEEYTRRLMAECVACGKLNKYVPNLFSCDDEEKPVMTIDAKLGFMNRLAYLFGELENMYWALLFYNLPDESKSIILIAANSYGFLKISYENMLKGEFVNFAQRIMPTVSSGLIKMDKQTEKETMLNFGEKYKELEFIYRSMLQFQLPEEQQKMVSDIARNFGQLKTAFYNG